MVNSFMGLEDELRIGLVTSFSVVAIEAVVLDGGGVDLVENIVPCLVKELLNSQTRPEKPTSQMHV